MSWATICFALITKKLQCIHVRLLNTDPHFFEKSNYYKKKKKKTEKAILTNN